MRNAAFPEPYPFPDPALADEDGLVALGVPVTPANRFDLVRDGSVDLECGSTTANANGSA